MCSAPHAFAPVLLAWLAGCGGSSTAPTPSPPQPPPPQSWVLAGTVSDAVSGAPVPGASLSFTTINQTITGSTDGNWSVTGTGTASTRQAVSVTAPGYVTYQTGVRWDQGGRTNIGLLLIPDRSPFSLSYFREFTRNGMEDPSALRPILRWTTTPNFYVNTFNPKTGQPLDPSEVGLVVQAIRSAVPQLTGGLYSAGVD